MISDQTSGIQSKSLRMETRNLKIQDGEDVDVLRRPDITCHKFGVSRRWPRNGSKIKIYYMTNNGPIKTLFLKNLKSLNFGV